MTLTKLTRWSLLATFTAVGVGAALGAAQTQTVRADTDQLPVCSWKSSGSAQTAVYHAATAVDKAGNVYVFGGLNKDGKVQQGTQVINMTTTNGTTLAGTKQGTGKQMTQKGWGAAAAYRPSSDPAKMGKIYVIGGAKTDLDYSKFVGVATPPATYVVEGEDTIFEYDIDANSWTAMNSGNLGSRLFPAATYSPEADAILVTGGMKDCDFKGAVDGKACSPDNFEAKWLTFDKTTGAFTGVASEGGGPQKIYGHTSVYDPTHKWIIVYGGTSTGNNADRKAWALDMSGATPAWKTLPDSPKGLAFHAAGYWPAMNWMVVNGGDSSAFFRKDEGFSSTTYGLNLSNPAAPAWVDLKATGLNPAVRIGAVANYVTNAAGLMNVVLSTGRAKLPSDLASSVTAVTNNDVLVCGEAPTAVATTPTGPTNTPGGPTRTPVTPRPTETVGPGAACAGLEAKAPAAAINAALANEQSIGGYGMACNPNVPMNPVSNPIRHNLSLRNVNLPYHPVYNGFVWKCGCP